GRSPIRSTPLTPRTPGPSRARDRRWRVRSAALAAEAVAATVPAAASLPGLVLEPEPERAARLARRQAVPAGSPAAPEPERAREPVPRPGPARGTASPAARTARPAGPAAAQEPAQEPAARL